MSEANTWSHTHDLVNTETAPQLETRALGAALNWGDRHRKPGNDVRIGAADDFNFDLAPELLMGGTLQSIAQFKHNFIWGHFPDSTFPQKVRLHPIGLINISEHFPGRITPVPIFTGLTFGYPPPDSAPFIPEAGDAKPLQFYGPFFTTLLRHVMTSEALTLEQKRHIVESRLHQLLDYQARAAASPFMEAGEGFEITPELPPPSRFDGLIVAMPSRPDKPTHAFMLGEDFTGRDEAVISSTNPLHGFVLPMPEDSENTYYVLAASEERKQALQQLMLNEAYAHWAAPFKQYLHGIFQETQRGFHRFREAVKNPPAAVAEKSAEEAIGQLKTLAEIPDHGHDQRLPYSDIVSATSEQLAFRDAQAQQLVAKLFLPEVQSRWSALAEASGRDIQSIGG